MTHHSETLVLPPLLSQLLEEGRWPRNERESNQFSLNRCIAVENIRKLAPEADDIYLLWPPFHTVREKAKYNPFWNWPMANPDGIDFDLAIDIGDLGLGLSYLIIELIHSILK